MRDSHDCTTIDVVVTDSCITVIVANAAVVPVSPIPRNTTIFAVRVAVLARIVAYTPPETVIADVWTVLFVATVESQGGTLWGSGKYLRIASIQYTRYVKEDNRRQHPELSNRLKCQGRAKPRVVPAYLGLCAHCLFFVELTSCSSTFQVSVT